MDTPRVSIIDDIIRHWFPVVGTLFVVAGMSYLFYEGIWQRLNETGRLTLGFLAGVALISGSYPLEKSSKIIADSILAGGLLMLYMSLIFGSRFDAAAQQALIPEFWALLIATLFTVGVAFFSYRRRSRYVLLIGIVGGYLTPFFIGQGDQIVDFFQKDQVFRYDLPLSAFLLYFLAINIAILSTANKFFLKGIGLLNAVGLFVGTSSLSYFMGGQFPDHAIPLALFSILVLGLHLASLCINAKQFEKETDPYLIAGYLLPLLWYTAMLDGLVEPYLERAAVAGLLLGSACMYFAGWHYLRRVVVQRQHASLYLGGILALALAVIKLQSYLRHYDGLIFAAIAFVFGILYRHRPVLLREMAFFFFAVFGLLMTLWHLAALNLPAPGFLSKETVAISLAVSPFLLGGFFPKRDEVNGRFESIGPMGCYLAVGTILMLIFLDLVRMEDLPRSLLFLTVPAAIMAYSSFVVASGGDRVLLIKLSLALAAAGFFSSLLTIIGRFHPFPADVRLLSAPETLVGALTLLLLLVLKNNLKRLARANADKTTQSFGPGWRFFLVFSFYTVLWAILSHELLAAFNSLDINLESEKIRGIRSSAISIWWIALAAWMIFLGVKDRALENEKNIGFTLLALTIFKILFIDLQHINTNLKVFVLLIVGGLMLAISYFANKRESLDSQKNSS